LGVKEMLELAKEAPPTPKPPVPSPSAPATEDDMVIPDAQATILSSGNEQGGFAGFFQRMSQGMTTKSEAEPVTPVTPVPPLAIQPVANPAPVAAPAPAPPPVEKAPPAPAIQVKSDEDGDIGKLLEGNIETLDGLKELVKKGSIPRIVAGIVNFAIHEKASDVHVEAFADEVVVRYRVDGQLAEVIKMPADLHAAVVSRIKILAKLRLDETRVPQDGRFEVNFSSVQVDLRVSILPTVHGEKVVMRILDKNRGITSLESLGIVGLAYENIFKSIQRPFGVCLATGPTGSGKSTSLYAILKQIATPNVNVSTLEDPVEYEMSGINQSQIRPKIGFTFAEGLRSLLRQDPNIIMVGEIRDGETANMATQAALTGHLVLSTLHTNDAAGAIPRLENMGIEPFLITSSLNMVIGQRLVRKICQNCKSEVSLPEGVRAKFVADIEKIRSINPTDAGRIKEPMVFYQGTGCDVCRGKGYEGRIGIYEVLVMSEAIEKMALDRAPGTKIAEQSQSEGMLTMYQDGLLKVLAGLTTLDEVLRETSNK
jgi:type II secretory ATPase GspE/PulE/Tfp pilus assembly ATPase PilB-like protein